MRSALQVQLEGKVIPLTEVKDPTFAQEILGKGAAIILKKELSMHHLTEKWMLFLKQDMH